MGRWLAVAEKLFKRPGNEPLSPFEVECACGHVVVGQRSAVVQTPICPACRAALFVLPASVYPQPKAPRRKVVLAPKPQIEFVALDDVVVGAEPGPTAKVVAPAKTALETPAAAREAPQRAPRRPVKQVVRAVVDIGRLRRKVFTPVRLVLAGVAFVVALTGWWIVHLRGLDEAERVVVSASKQGNLALEERDLGEASRQFRLVRQALDALGRDDPQARALRQIAGETSAAADLAKSSLFEILHEAAEAEAGGSRMAWAETFHSSYRDEWIVLDVRVSRAKDFVAGRRFDIEYPLADGMNHGVVVADLDIFENLISPDGMPTRVIFAAQLEDCRRDRGLDRTWQIVLRPSTGFFWSSPARLELLGVAADDGTKRLLGEQTSRMGIVQ
jgi:hypothetical protein